MAVTVVAVTSGTTGAGTISTPIATAFPADWKPGDHAVLFGHSSGTALTLTPSAGWPAPPAPTWPVAEGSNSRLYAWVRQLQAGDTPPTLTPSGAITCGWTMVVLRGGDSIAQVAVSTAASSPLTLPTLTGVAAGSMLVAAAHCRVGSGTIPTTVALDAVAYTSAAPWSTSRPTANANIRAAAGTRLIGLAGTYGGEQVTSDVTGSMIGALVAVSAAATGTDAALAATLPALAATIAAGASGHGSIAAVLPALTGAASGESNGRSNLAVALPALAGQFAGDAVADVAAAAVLPALTGAIAGQADASASLVGVLPALRASVTAADGRPVLRGKAGLGVRTGAGASAGLRAGPTARGSV
ncbi:hypothetical protein AB0C02_28115 [Micromonospora sp. NPDC048999]|uniref:hypothetical protein n=1 Tax=Micromonospora sp. NPDC048999 TaxID=3155391 RepID=UPI0033D9314E